MTRLLLALVFGLACAAAVGAPKEYSGDDAAQDVWLLEKGVPDTWVPAMRRLMGQRYLPGLAVASVLRRMDALEDRNRVVLCRALGTAIRDPRAQQALLEFARDPYEDVRRAARTALVEHSSGLAPETLLKLAIDDGGDRVRFLRAWLTRYDEIKQIRSSRLMAARQAARKALRDDDAFAALSELATDSDKRVAHDATEALGLLIDTRVEDFLFERAREGSITALWQLAYRGDARAFEPLVQWTRAEAERATSDWDRRKAYKGLGNYLPAVFFPNLVALYRSAAGAPERQGAQLAIEGHLGLGLLDEPIARRELEALATDTDPFLRASAQKVLSWGRSRDAERAAPRLLRENLLVGAAVAGIAVGLVIFLLAFRLLMLRRLVHGLPAQKIRSVAPGLVALKGVVQLHAGQFAKHPFTGERCVVREGERLPFWLDDGTGRILVDPQGAALLSEDGVVVPGERVLVVGTFRRAYGPEAESTTADDEPGARPSMMRRDRELTWFTRIGGWLVRA
ncbi:MAG: HEAT repeat domain-containing protein, partial [Pseudomonadota bacterium]